MLRFLFLLLIGWLLWAMFGPALMNRPIGPDPTPPMARPERPVTPDLNLPLQGDIDRILIEKGARRLSVYQQGNLVREYRIALGFAPDGDKVRQGDGKTPEGVFKVDRRNDRSQFHLSLGLDYPQPEDRRRASVGGYNPGGDIFIHGQPNHIAEGYRVKGDWTEGCIAIDNHQIDELFAATRIGTEVEIRP
ncbi:MAG TPA: L,D-transpeptidase family protein [Paracoccus sp. (in: a-proteobacteria)]|uniref:L,D-transpeptidase family protein n=1 Tax=uncultured Paracoccus sp. TaxID=189685 RepID=UPI00261B963C|nr:L,D-transpeptidase family protein [uncultured Paracoccus sp.]HMQ42607.1 L,D-transpeptidase family protein [Paracoccus sp. (in: a-proteobacteria)]HMR37754.1 L,D-transpeptidase family protein [Paracoccus sp. (in: a-proteobacteria)]